MGSPYLNNDESIILSTHDVIINTIPAEMILTSQRLMLVDVTHKKLLPQDIPFPAIETVTIGENSGENPVLAISVVTPDETRQPLAVVFPQRPKAHREGERDEWAVRLKEQCIAGQETAGIQPVELLPPWVPGPLPEEPTAEQEVPVVRPGTRFRSPAGPQRTGGLAGSSRGRTVLVAGIVVILLIAVAAAFVWYAPPFTAAPSAPATPAPTPVLTAEPTTVPTVIPTSLPPTQPVSTPTATPAPTLVPTETVSSIIPSTGVWARVNYDGNYTGEVGAPGRFKEVVASGDRFFQIPARDETIQATIQKADNSGKPLTIEFYSDGVMVKSGTITAPKGSLVLSFNLRTLATPVPTRA